MSKRIQRKSSGIILTKKGINVRTPYEHQHMAMHNLSMIDQEKQYSTLIVLEVKHIQPPYGY